MTYRKMKAITLTWPSGEPVRAGELKAGAWVTIELATGKVLKPKRPAPTLVGVAGEAYKVLRRNLDCEYIAPEADPSRTNG
jgi:hypothetical protein